MGDSVSRDGSLYRGNLGGNNIEHNNVRGYQAQQVYRAAVWTVSARIISQIVRIGVGALLGRLLEPGEFGIVAMAMVFSGFLVIFSDAGLRSAIIQFRDLNQRGLSSVFWLSVALGSICMVLLIGAAPWIAKISKIPALESVVSIISVSLVFTSSCAVPVGLLQRQFLFRKTAKIEMFSEVLGGIVAVSLAVAGAKYWALVAQTLVVSGGTTILYLIASKWRPGLMWDGKQIKRVFRFSGNIMAFNAVNYWARNLDSLLLGRFYGTSSLGYYNRAYALMMYPYSMLQSVLTPIIHPALSSIQDDVERMRQSYLKLIKFQMIVSFPLAMTLGLLADPLVRTLWGPQWGASVPIFQILCFVSAIQPSYAISGNVYLARNRSDLYFKMGGLFVLSVCTGIGVGVKWGAVGVAIGYTLANLVAIPFILSFLMTRLLHGRMYHVMAQCRTPVMLAGAVGLTVSLCNSVLPTNVPAVVHLIIGCSVAGVAFVLFFHRIDHAYMVETFTLIPFLKNSRWVKKNT